MTGTALTRTSLAILVVGFLVLFVGGGSRFAIGLFLKPMAEDLGWTRSTLAASAGIFLAVSATCMFISGKLADRFSLKAVLCGGLVVAALGIGAMRYVTTPWQALLSYGVIFAIGNGIASIAPVGVMVSRRFPGRTGFANAVTTSGIGIGQLIIISALTAALAAIGWRAGFMWLGIINLALVPVVLFAMSKSLASNAPSPPEQAPSGDTVREAARGKQFWLLIVVYAICGFQDFSSPPMLSHSRWTRARARFSQEASWPPWGLWAFWAYCLLASGVTARDPNKQPCSVSVCASSFLP